MTEEKLQEMILSFDLSKAKEIVPNMAYLCDVPSHDDYEPYHLIILTNNSQEKVGGVLKIDDFDLQLLIFKEYRNQGYMSRFFKTNTLQKVWPENHTINWLPGEIEDDDDYHKKCHLNSLLEGYTWLNEDAVKRKYLSGEFKGEKRNKNRLWDSRDYKCFYPELTCPKCGQTTTADIVWDCDDGTEHQREDGSMETVYSILDKTTCWCKHCNAEIPITGQIVEYPMGHVDSVDIHVDIPMLTDTVSVIRNNANHIEEVDFRSIQKGDTFFVDGKIHTALSDARYGYFNDYYGYTVTDNCANIWYPKHLDKNVKNIRE